MKEYYYKKNLFFRRVTFTAAFCTVIFLYGCLKLIVTANAAWIIVLIVSGYTVWNSFVSISNPSKIILSDTEIVFCAYGREDRYIIKELKDFKVKDFPDVKKMFVRVNNPTLFTGRYWIPASSFNDSDELYKRILSVENKLNPNSLKARAQRR